MSSGPGGADRRKRQRLTIRGPIVVTMEDGETINGELQDVSLLGFRFSSNVLLPDGDKVLAQVRFPSGKMYATDGVVRHATDMPPYQYGVAFTDATVERIIKEASRVG